ncbi:DNA-processing protein DprA [Accumulibacter sp.]|uniref:DNA-processing protein DprA n=1 Tax=Accumulibacter sp. TaxID=2053492 RepID=UPI0025CEFE5D|nr:DNA-processing protein DprA [Accumulibacter sp.]MCM8612156.1 DNA-processing protein DprA [Accumulibacter sp.]MCM8635822.1 DNA-processing protein DprA [Accumulibacter sp.]MCM8639541.1 DNA-processing protein DprA [Accumulibacter sp.]
MGTRAAELLPWLRLTLTPGIGGETQRKLLRAFGPPEAIFSAERPALAAVAGERAASLLLDQYDAERLESALAWSTQPAQHLVSLADPEYPQSLLQTPDPPTLLYVLGRLELLNSPALAIVGSRNPTPQGLGNAERFAAALADAGLTIASGLALGIDAGAHRGALARSGNTVAFIGTGIDRVYPARNRELAREIGRRGTIISELALGTPPVAANFPRRNRLIAGFSRGTLVIEATVDSGSLITARIAAEQGREVFAIPGSIHSPQSRGCHRLIKQGAKLVETVTDVLDELRWNVSRESSTTTAETVADAPADTATDAARLLQSFGFDPFSLDELVTRAGLTAECAAVLLLELELQGQIGSMPGGRYQRLSGPSTSGRS